MPRTLSEAEQDLIATAVADLPGGWHTEIKMDAAGSPRAFVRRQQDTLGAPIFMIGRDGSAVAFGAARLEAGTVVALLTSVEAAIDLIRSGVFHLVEVSKGTTVPEGWEDRPQ